MHCPKCNAPELNEATNKLNIRGFKVNHSGYWWSHCLVCNVWFNELNEIEQTATKVGV